MKSSWHRAGMAFLFYFPGMNHICVNGKMMPAGEPALLVSNRGYRYGDGLFETMKLWKGNILLEQYHFERLFAGCDVMQLAPPSFFSAEKLKTTIIQLCQKNNCIDLARIRLSVFRGNGGLYEDDRTLQFVIEAWPLNETVNSLNENGLVIGIYPNARKSKDHFSNLKSASFLPYAMAAIHTREHKLNDCLVLNTNGNITDSTIANVFIIKDGAVFTPSLKEACVNGVMRRHLIEQLSYSGIPVHETAISPANMNEADEVFLTNAINGIRWVKQLGDKHYTNTQTVEIYNRFIKTIFS